jgi:hypothetical protein
MAKRLYMALLFSVVLGGSAAAQTSSIAGSGLANPYGAVTLPGTTTPSNGAAGSSNSLAGVSAGVGSGVGVASARSTTSAAPPSGQSGSGGSSTPGTAARSSNVPAWVQCLPSGSSGMAPFLTGTNLSCAP